MITFSIATRAAYRHCDAMRGILILALLFTGCATALRADVTDQQIRHAQANVDNEAAVAYGGKVGKLDAIFVLEIAGTKVDGYYYYPTRDKNFLYRLRGTNPKDGVLVLQEFTDVDDGRPKHTASCRLIKTVTDGRIRWSGTLQNTDGRTFPMHFSRPK